MIVRVPLVVTEGVLGGAACRSRGRRRRARPCPRQHPHDRVVGPDGAGIAVARAELDFLLLEALTRREVVGEEAVLTAVRDPRRLAVGPEAARGAVRLVELELALLDALPGREVVGVDGVVGARAVLGRARAPSRRTRRPWASRGRRRRPREQRGRPPIVTCRIFSNPCFSPWRSRPETRQLPAQVPSCCPRRPRPSQPRAAPRSWRPVA